MPRRRAATKRSDRLVDGQRAVDEPLRTCIGCRRRRPRSELIALACPDGDLLIGSRNRGRGASICADVACITAAGKTRAFSRAFRSNLADAIFADTLRGWLGNPAH